MVCIVMMESVYVWRHVVCDRRVLLMAGLVYRRVWLFVYVLEAPCVFYVAM